MFDISKGAVMAVAVMAAADQGDWLVAHRWEMDRGESAWLEALVEFDRFQGWAADGQLSCADWLMWRTDMARPTAHEKLRIAHQLRRRPLIAEAFRDGRLSYSAVRAITRMEEPDPDVDGALIQVAESGSVADVERAVRCYQLHAEQHRPPSDADDRRGLRIVRGYDGTGRIEVTLDALEIEEFAAAFQAFLDLAEQPVDEPVDESSAGDSSTGTGSDQSPDPRPAPRRRADAFMDLVRVALRHAGEDRAAGADRYLVHLVTSAGGTELADGTPVDAATAERVACDSSTVAHLLGGEGEPLALGRRTRTWSPAQRRAVLVRDGGHCRFPGCRRRIADVHHQRPRAQGGPTDVDNGFLACPRHHTLLHRGFRTTGSPNAALAFYRPDGTLIATTEPIRRRRMLPEGLTPCQ
ncbi:MAG: HNH endonuclease [Acidimicrobiales bacterium]